ncbi:hypothetical protein K439DRAFT_1634941 [Ramaria rubella]|nr:hypothetical protein K439DRAFT_1634941 [Ramaria rubella]
MPEQQASPSSSQPLSAYENQTRETPQADVVTSAPSGDSASTKRTYLSLLPPPQLIDLILAIDANRQTVIFPHDLDSAIKALQRPARQSQPPSPKTTPAVTVIVKAEPTTSPIPPPSLPPPPQQNPTPPVPPSVVLPPQYKPPAYKQTAHQPVYPYTHTPYYPPPQPHIQISPPPQPPPAAPPRHPLFTSAPLTRDPNKPPVVRPTPPAVSSRDDPNAMPSYEEMIVEAIVDVGDGEGTAPKILFAWMASHYPLQQNFRPSASQALHKALKRGRLEKIGGKYRLNPSWGGGPTTSKRATRRPTANRATPPPTTRPPSAPRSSAQVPPPGYAHPHPPYAYAPYPHHPSLPPHPYGPAYAVNGTTWGAPQPYPQPVNVAPSAKAEDMDEDEDVESEEVDTQEPIAVKDVDMNAEGQEIERKKEQIKQSLVRLARVLRRFARKGEGTEKVIQV